MNPTHAGALRRAARKVGGRARLAGLLQASECQIADWVSGDHSLPDLYFMRTVEILLADEEELARLKHSADLSRRIPLRVDRLHRRAYVDGATLHLPLTQWALLESLLWRIGHVVSRWQIGREIAAWTGGPVSDAFQMHVFRLRLKIDPLGFCIRTAPGAGYALESRLS